jgi:hypothetical protein
MRVFHLFLIVLLNIFSQKRYLNFISFESFNLKIFNFMKKMSRKKKIRCNLMMFWFGFIFLFFFALKFFLISSSMNLICFWCYSFRFIYHKIGWRKYSSLFRQRLRLSDIGFFHFLWHNFKKMKVFVKNQSKLTFSIKYISNIIKRMIF